VINTGKTASDLAPEQDWFKSSHSSGSEGNCVEAARLPAGLGVRDSKDKTGPALVFKGTSWDAFLASVRTGEFDVEG
jgi:hypothetical protein